MNSKSSPRRSKRKSAQQRLPAEIIKAELCGSKVLHHRLGNQSQQRTLSKTTSSGRNTAQKRLKTAAFQKLRAENPKTSLPEENNSQSSRRTLKISTDDTDSYFFCCPKCSLYFSRPDYEKFRRHLNAECLVKKRLPCRLCGHVYSSQNILDYHQEHVHENPHPKSKILMTKPRKEYLELSLKLDNLQMKELEDDDWPEDESEAVKLAEIKGVWRCWICFYESTQKTLWTTHINRIHPNAVGIIFPCSSCDKQFRRKHHLREHVNEVHPDDIGYNCKDCGRKFLHKNLRHVCEKIDCKICGETFLTRGARSKHMLTHPEFHPFSCPQCPKEFKKKEYLTLHMRVHNDIRPYSCEFCDTTFRSKSHYNNHRRLHTGEKPYICHSCGRGFFSPQGLNSHLTSHVGDKTEICGDCGKGFRTSNDLKRHRFTHSGEKPFECKHCHKRFNRRGNCLVHEKSAHENRPCFRCQECDSKFDKVSKLEKHMKKHDVTKSLTQSHYSPVTSTVDNIYVEDVASIVEISGACFDASSSSSANNLVEVSA